MTSVHKVRPVLNFVRKSVTSSASSFRKWRTDSSSGSIRRWPHRGQYSSVRSAEQFGHRDMRPVISVLVKFTRELLPFVRFRFPALRDSVTDACENGRRRMPGRHVYLVVI